MKILKTTGKVLDEHGEHWLVVCPHCDKETEFEGFFDSSLTDTCIGCSGQFQTTMIIFEDESYIE